MPSFIIFHPFLQTILSSHARKVLGFFCILFRIWSKYPKNCWKDSSLWMPRWWNRWSLTPTSQRLQKNGSGLAVWASVNIQVTRTLWRVRPRRDFVAPQGFLCCTIMFVRTWRDPSTSECRNTSVASRELWGSKWWRRWNWRNQEHSCIDQWTKKNRASYIMIPQKTSAIR